MSATPEALLAALGSGDAALAQALMVAEVPPSLRDSAERTPLMLAASGAAPHLIKQFIANGADLEARDQQGRTALGHAVELGQLDAVQSLIQEGAQVSLPSEAGGSLAAHGLREGRQAAVIMLLEAGVDPTSKGANGEPLAQIAVEEDQAAVLAELVDRGLDLKAIPRQNGSDLLHLSFEKGQDKTLRFLLENGMDADQKNAQGQTILHAVAGVSKDHLLAPLKKHGASFDALDAQGWSALHLAILANDHEFVDQLLELGADVDQRSEQGSQSLAPLALAIEKDLFPIARLLLRHGAKPGDEVYKAVKRGGEDGLHLVTNLIASGASASPDRAQSPDPLDSPVALAIRSDEDEIAKALLDAGASHESRGMYGQKLLHLAVARGNNDMVKILLELGADPSEPFAAESKSFLELVKTDGVARWAMSKSAAFYPIMVASDSGNVEMAQDLIRHGANSTKSTKVGRHRMWPLTFATRRSDIDMMQVILGREPGRSKLWIKVDLSEQRAYVYENDKQVYRTNVSTGKRGNRTPKGKYVITNKYRHWTSTLYDSKMPYFQRLSASDFGFHVGVLPGYPASHGCIRMPHSAARKLFGMTRVGDYVEIVP